MTYSFKEQKLSDEYNSSKSLTMLQKILFGMFCWGVQSWGLADSFHSRGYFQKNTEAKKAMHIGIVVYSVIISLFIISLFFYK